MAYQAQPVLRVELAFNTSLPPTQALAAFLMAEGSLCSAPVAAAADSFESLSLTEYRFSVILLLLDPSFPSGTTQSDLLLLWSDLRTNSCEL